MAFHQLHIFSDGIWNTNARGTLVLIYFCSLSILKAFLQGHPWIKKKKKASADSWRLSRWKNPPAWPLQQRRRFCIMPYVHLILYTTIFLHHLHLYSCDMWVRFQVWYSVRGPYYCWAGFYIELGSRHLPSTKLRNWHNIHLRDHWGN